MVHRGSKERRAEPGRTQAAVTATCHARGETVFDARRPADVAAGLMARLAEHARTGLCAGGVWIRRIREGDDDDGPGL